MMDKTLSIDNVCKAISPHVDVSPEAIHLEAIPTGKFNDSWFVRLPQRELVLRVAPDPEAVFLFYEKNMMRQEPGIHSVLLKQTDIPVATIVAFDDSREIIGRDFILMERLPGRPMSELARCDTDRVLEQTGEYLAQAHAVTAESGRYGYLGEHKCMEPRDSWAEAFQVMWNKLLDDIVDVGIYSEDERGDLSKLLDRDYAIFDRPVEPSLLHMDVWEQNILIDENNNVTGLVDWDRGLWGDVEIEFAVLDYCGISQPAFWRGYGRSRDDSPEARRRNIYYLLYEMQKYIVIRKGRGGDAESAMQYKRHCMQMIDTRLR